MKEITERPAPEGRRFADVCHHAQIDAREDKHRLTAEPAALIEQAKAGKVVSVHTTVGEPGEQLRSLKRAWAATGPNIRAQLLEFIGARIERQDEGEV